MRVLLKPKRLLLSLPCFRVLRAARKSGREFSFSGAASANSGETTPGRRHKRPLTLASGLTG